MKKLLLLLAFLLVPGILSAACTTTHYISTSGSDSNNGLSTGAPWLHHPYAPGWTGSYSHAVGDCFVFKGGDVFHRSGGQLPINIVAGGDATHQDLYTVDFAWGTGTSTGSVDTIGTVVIAHRPAVNGGAGTQGNPFSTSWTGSITISGVTYTIASVQSHDQLTLTTSAGSQNNVAYSYSGWKQPEFDDDNYVWTGSDAAQNKALFYLASPWVTINNFHAHGIKSTLNARRGIVISTVSGLSNNYATTNEVVQNVWFHAVCPNVNGQSDDLDGDMVGSGNTTVINSVFSNLECPGSGSGLEDSNGDIYGTTIHDIAQAMIGDGHVMHDNVFYNINWPVDAYDGAAHENTDELFTDGGVYYIYNNYAYNFATGWSFGGPPGWSGACTSMRNDGSFFYVWNNVFVAGGTGNGATWITDNRETDVANCGGSHLWNNTFQYDCNCAIARFESGGSGTTSVLDYRNNHWITQATSTPIQFDSAAYVTLTNTFNITQNNSTANGQGYVTTNFYEPTSSSNSTVNAGTNLTSQCSYVDPHYGTMLVASLCADFSNSVLPYLWTSRARPSSGSWDSGAYTFSLSSPPGPPPVKTLLVDTTTLPSGTVGSGYSAMLAASGGVLPYTWTGSGFPSGLSLSASGVLTGTPTVSGTFSTMESVTDAVSTTASKVLVLLIVSAPPPPPPPPLDTVTFGLVTAGTATDSGDSGFINASRYCAPSSGGSAVSFSANVRGTVSPAPNNKWQGFIFSDNAGKIVWPPLAFTAAGVLTANTTNTLPINAKIVGGQCYWLGYATNGLNSYSNNVTLNPIGGQTTWTRIAFGTMPTAATSSSGNSTSPLSLSVTYSTVAPPPPPPPPALSVSCVGLVCTLTPSNIPSGTPYSGSVTASGVTAPIVGIVP